MVATENLANNPDAWVRAEQFLTEAILAKGGPITLGEMIDYGKSRGYVPADVETSSEFLRLFDVNHYVRKRRKEADIRFTESGFKKDDVYSYPSLLVGNPPERYLTVADMAADDKIDMTLIEIVLVE